MKCIEFIGILGMILAASWVDAGQERPLILESALIREGYELFAVAEMKKPLAQSMYLLVRSGSNEIKIQDTAGFAQIVRGITTAEEALEFVRLVTSQELRPLLQDVYYAEIHKKTASQQAGEEATQTATALETETTKKIMPQSSNEADLWFAIDPEQYEEWGLHEPIVTEEEGGYKIERFVACYPRISKDGLKPAQLVKIWEWVTPNAAYKAEIQEIIAEGEAIQRLLLFTK